MALCAVLGMALSSSCSRRWSYAGSRPVDLCFAVRCTENSVPSAAVLVRAELYLEFNRVCEDYKTILNKNLHHLAQILCQYENSDPNLGLVEEHALCKIEPTKPIK